MINLAYKDIQHTLSKFLVTAMGVGMLLGIVLIMIGVYRGMVEDARILLNDIHADLWIVQQDTLGPFAESSRLYRDLEDSLKALEGIDKTAALTFQNLQVFDSQQKAVRVLAVGYDPMGDYPIINPSRLIEGRSLHAQHYEMVVTDTTGLKLGEKIAIGREIYSVVGLTQGTVSSSGDPIIYVSLKDAQQMQFSYSNPQIRADRARGVQDKTPQLVNTIVASLKPGYLPDAVIHFIQGWKYLTVYSHEQQSLILSRNVIERSSKQIGLFTLILVVVSGIIIGLIIYTMTLEKMKEIAIMKLIGIPNYQIIKMIMQETLILGTLAFAFGNLFAYLIHGNFPKKVLLLWPDAFMLLSVILTASLLASLVGVYKVVKADPSTAIGG
ncbi:ABC transporter permease [Thiomicrorhabdus aquaedulcis]|uniref:ABC transporter permease n=1 Tax=Thiomicrorhabdus aquaedulcis TaxID=2211106 RepID=UPI000FD99C45|nr:ABC transporter permease [Thiomicrorhabdus aquaedulcis]